MATTTSLLYVSLPRASVRNQGLVLPPAVLTGLCLTVCVCRRARSSCLRFEMLLPFSHLFILCFPLSPVCASLSLKGVFSKALRTSCSNGNTNTVAA